MPLVELNRKRPGISPLRYGPGTKHRPEIQVVLFNGIIGQVNDGRRLRPRHRAPPDDAKIAQFCSRPGVRSFNMTVPPLGVYP